MTKYLYYCGNKYKDGAIVYFVARDGGVQEGKMSCCAGDIWYIYQNSLDGAGISPFLEYRFSWLVARSSRPGHGGVNIIGLANTINYNKFFLSKRFRKAL